MSSPIWTQCGGTSNLRRWAATAWRIVEDQSRVSTRKLVDSDREQDRLEALIEGVKPPLPDTPPFANLHYLLATPFRYPPLRWGSRFRSRADPGVWYGSETIETALAEKAYYRLRFLADSQAAIRSEVTLTAFHAPVKSARAIDLAAPPFDAFTSAISSPGSYAQSQPLGQAMRADQVIMARYASARDPNRGHNFAVFSPLGFPEKTVHDASRESWHCFATAERVEFRVQRFNAPRSLGFDRTVFEIDGRLPVIAS